MWNILDRLNILISSAPTFGLDGQPVNRFFFFVFQRAFTNFSKRNPHQRRSRVYVYRRKKKYVTFCCNQSEINRIVLFLFFLFSKHFIYYIYTFIYKLNNPSRYKKYDAIAVQRLKASAATKRFFFPPFYNYVNSKRINTDSFVLLRRAFFFFLSIYGRTTIRSFFSFFFFISIISSLVT